MDGNQAVQVFPRLSVGGSFDLAGEIKAIPADDAAFDKAVAGVGDLLLSFLAYVNSHGSSTTMHIRVYCLALGGVVLTSSVGKMIMKVVNAVAQFECNLLIERTQVSLAQTKV